MQVVRPHGSRAGARRGNGRFACARAKLSVEGDTPSLAVSAGRQRGRRRSAAGGEALRDHGPADGRRQPLGSVRVDRHRGRDELAGRRLHASYQHHPVRHQPVPDASRAVRPTPRLRFNLGRRVVAVIRYRASVPAGALDPGAHRPRQGEIRPALLLGRRRWHQSAHCRRTFQPARGRQYRGRAVQGRRSCGHGSHCRGGGSHVRQHLAGDRLRESRTDASVGRNEREAQSCDARAADRSRGRRARLRVRDLVRRCGAQRHVARDCGHAKFAHP